MYNAKLVREKISRTNDFGQAGDTYRKFEDWERDELISNLVDALKICKPVIQQKMIQYFTNADPDYGRRVAEGLAAAKVDSEHMGSAANREGAEIAEQSGRARMAIKD